MDYKPQAEWEDGKAVAEFDDAESEEVKKEAEAEDSQAHTEGVPLEPAEPSASPMAQSPSPQAPAQSGWPTIHELLNQLDRCGVKFEDEDNMGSLLSFQELWSVEPVTAVGIVRKLQSSRFIHTPKHWFSRTVYKARYRHDGGGCKPVSERDT